MPVIDWLFPVLEAVHHWELSLIPGLEGLRPQELALVAQVQAWRWALVQCAHGARYGAQGLHEVHGAPDGTQQEKLTYLWARLSHAVLTWQRVTGSDRPSDVKLLEVVRSGNAALGIQEGMAPLLWATGAHPHLPMDAQLASDQAELLRISAALR